MPKPTFKITCEAQNEQAIIRIDGYIDTWANSAANFKMQVDTLVANGIKNAQIYINSGGGNVFEADEINNEINKFSGQLTARLGALCASAATSIACNCDKVIASKNTSYMIHKPATAICGNSDEVKADLKLLENKEQEYAQMYADKTGLPLAKIETMWMEDYWMNAEEAEKLGFVDEIDGEVDITPEDVEAISAFKNAPKIVATATPKLKQTENLNNQISTHMRELLITMSGLDAKATDVQLAAWVENMKAKAASADALQAKLTTLENTAKEEKANVVLEAAIAAKKIVVAQKDFYKKNLIADYEGTKAMLDAMPGLTALSAHIEKTPAGDTEDRTAWSYNDYKEKNPEALMELATNDEPKFKKLLEAHYGKAVAATIVK